MEKHFFDSADDFLSRSEKLTKSEDFCLALPKSFLRIDICQYVIILENSTQTS